MLIDGTYVSDPYEVKSHLIQFLNDSVAFVYNSCTAKDKLTLISYFLF